VLNQATHVFNKDFLGNMISSFSLLSTQVLKEFGIGRHLLDVIKEGEVDFHLFEDLHHLLYFLSLFLKMRRCIEMF
jgi:hypothetical protein